MDATTGIRDEKKTPTKAFGGYAAAVGGVAAGWALRVALSPVLDAKSPYLTFFPVVMFAAWFGGLGPGLLAAVLSLLVVLYPVIPPWHSLRDVNSSEVWAGIVFLAASSFICALNEALRQSRRRSNERLQQLMVEIALRNRAEQAMVESRRDAERARDLLHTTLTSIGDAVIATDAAGRITFLNTVARKLTGWSDAEALGQPISDVFVIVNEKTRLVVENPVERTIREGVIMGLANHTVLISKDGRDIPIEDSAAPIRDDGRTVLGAVLVFRDVTERKQAEALLQESQQRLRAIYDGTYEYLGLLAPDGTLLEANRASLTFANNTRADVVGRPFWNTPWFERTPGAPAVIRDAVARAAAGEFVRFEAAVRRPSGDCPIFDISFHPVTNELGKVVLIVPEGRDITDLKLAEEELKRTNEKLTKANRELEEFAFVASHDLQEPLRTVNIYSQLMLRRMGGGDAELTKYAGFVQQGVKHMEALIRDLLEYSRTGATQELPSGTVSLSASLDESLSMLKSVIDETGAVITSGSLPMVRGEASQLAQVFQNLLSNAIKYRKKDLPPVIHISSTFQDAEWIVTVRDNGIGFEARFAARIFGLFKRLHKEEYEGTGLGLAICQRIVERYGGRIWAESKLGEGATFYFALPGGEK